MLALPNKNTPVLIYGITSRIGEVHTELALAYGTNIVAGVSHEKGLTEFLSLPVFKTVKEAVKIYKPKICVVFSTPLRAFNDTKEAIKSKIPLVVCAVEHVPHQDVLRLKELAEKEKVELLGPASTGIVVPNQSVMVGTIPAHLFNKGNVGIISRSSSLTYEVLQQLKSFNLGVSACVSLGSMAIMGTDFVSAYQAFLSDPKTKIILAIGELTGAYEEDLACFYKNQKKKKPLFVYIPGRKNAPYKSLPLLGTELISPKTTVEIKQKLLKQAGAVILTSLMKIGEDLASWEKDEK